MSKAFLYAFTDANHYDTMRQAKHGFRGIYKKDSQHLDWMFSWGNKFEFPAIKESEDYEYEETMLKMFFNLNIEEKEKALGLEHWERPNE
jgi:hypothetical protein